MNAQPVKTEKGIKTSRPPVVAILGHVDHGKSSLLDYIRKTNVVAGEAGGITQHLGAYEVVHTTKEGKTHKITFLDTPGHEAFKGIRSRGASVADIGILIVSGEEGVKPQTLEAIDSIKKTDIPYIVAITKIDKPTANVERTKQNLAENQLYVEGYGGDIPFVAISSKTGEGVADLLDLIILVAELHGVSAKRDAPLKAFVIEANVDEKNGIWATIILKEGVLRKGAHLVAGRAYTPTRRLENLLGEPIAEAEAGTPACILGWSDTPPVGAECLPVENKRAAEEYIFAAQEKRKRAPANTATTSLSEEVVLPLVIKADTGGGLEAVEQEVRQQETDTVKIKIISRGIGAINESDLKSARGGGTPVVVGLNVGIDSPAKGLYERGGMTVETFDVIYKLSDWVAERVKERAPKVKVTTITASARVLKIFTTEKDRQVVGGRVLEGELKTGDEFKIFRRDAVVGNGRVRELQRFKEKISSALKDSEFGASVSTSVALMPNDRIEAVTTNYQ